MWRIAAAIWVQLDNCLIVSRILRNVKADRVLSTDIRTTYIGSPSLALGSPGYFLDAESSNCPQQHKYRKKYVHVIIRYLRKERFCWLLFWQLLPQLEVRHIFLAKIPVSHHRQSFFKLVVCGGKAIWFSLRRHFLLKIFTEGTNTFIVCQSVNLIWLLAVLIGWFNHSIYSYIDSILIETLI